MKKIILCLAALAVSLANHAGKDFKEQEITVYNKTAGIKLGGTLTMPAQMAPKAAVVLASGSGAQNRDEEVLGHRPFKRIAEFLSRNGYAVLRMDDRGVGTSQGDPGRCALQDYVTDLSAGIAKLDSCFSGKLPKGIIGHSEGGVAAVIAANRDSSCRFIVTLGAPAWSGDSIVMSQSRAMSVAATGRWDGENLQRKLLDLVKSDMPEIMLCQQLYAMLSGNLSEMSKHQDIQNRIYEQVAVMAAPSYRSFIKYNPAPDISLCQVPWLALNGDKDMQVPPDNLQTIRELNPKVETRLLTGHNHLFQMCATGSPAEYAGLAESMTDETLAAILDFLTRRVPQ